jgi:hypothetical protein
MKVMANATASARSPPVVLVDCFHRFEELALDLVQHPDRDLGSGMDRDQKISDRDDVAQAVGGGFQSRVTSCEARR